jgi:hypothetical protein
MFLYNLHTNKIITHIIHVLYYWSPVEVPKYVQPSGLPEDVHGSPSGY